MPQFERRYVAEYCLTRWPAGGYQLNFPLGPIPEYSIKEMGYEAAARYWRPYRPEIDAIKFFDDGLILIETKVIKAWHVLGQLLLYKELVPYTEELRVWWGKDIQLRIVMPERQPLAEEIAKRVGITIDVFQTPEIMEQRRKYDRYTTKEYQVQLALKMARRRELGVE